MKKKRRIVLAVFLAYILYVIAGMLALFIHQKSVSDAGKSRSGQRILSETGRKENGPGKDCRGKSGSAGCPAGYDSKGRKRDHYINV